MHGHLMKDKKLVILATKFGLEFSGGCIATCKLAEAIQDNFSSIIVLANTIGKHHIKNIIHIHFNDLSEAKKILSNFNRKDCIFYGDFYDAIAFCETNIPFYFTYHDNWPEQSLLSETHQQQSDFFIPIYKRIFKSALAVFSVSKYKEKFIQKYTDKTHLLRNGILQPVNNKQYRPFKAGDELNLLMTGNIDERKYKLAIPVFQYLNETKTRQINIKIFGKINDDSIADQLQAFDFVQIMGYAPRIDFQNYDAYLSTSFIENLSIAVVEALANKLPVLCFDVGGLHEVVQHQKNGILIPLEEPQKMADTIHEIAKGKIKFDFSTTHLSAYDWNKSGDIFMSIISTHQT